MGVPERNSQGLSSEFLRARLEGFIGKGVREAGSDVEGDESRESDWTQREWEGRCENPTCVVTMYKR